MNLTSFFEAFFLGYVVLFFLSVGFDAPEQVLVRMGYGGILLGGAFLLRKKDSLASLKNLATGFLLTFLGFEFVRACWFLGQKILWEVYLFGPLLKWSFYIGCFLVSLAFFKTRGRVRRLLWVLGLAGFFLAMNAIPPLLKKALVEAGAYGYLASPVERVFFHPLFYSHPWLKAYLFSPLTHPNYAGDIIALGFFPALGLFFYSLKRGVEEMPFRLRSGRAWVSSLGLSLTLALASAAAVILFLSRGTILFFSIAFLVYLLAATLKFPSLNQRWITGGLLFLFFGFLLWSVNLEKVWKELATIKVEFTSPEPATLSTLRQGGQRALAMYRHEPLWGVGTGGYPALSQKPPLPGMEPIGRVPYLLQLRAMNHLLHVLAEEGSGAFLYFLFLLAYFYEWVKGLGRVQGRFQFFAGLSLGTSVGMVSAHALIYPLLEQFSILIPVSILMGASLAVLRKDFEHHS